jgi:aminopeptidase
MGTIDQGAKNAVEICMNVRRGEHVLIVTDKATLTVGKALKGAAEIVTSNVQMYVLEDYGTRPMACLPREIESAIPKANVTFWAAQALEGEFEALRGPFVDAAVKYARHGHMPGITVRCMEEGMCSDYSRIARFTQALYEIMKNVKRIDVTNGSGTKLRVDLNPEWRWIKDDGMYHEKGDWGNLPQGELFTAAAESNGQMVIDEVGDWFGEKYGCLTKPESSFATPVYINVERSRVDLGTLECDNPQLKRELIDYLKTDKNSNRAGEFALPTNVELMAKPLIGNMLQDEKARVHHAFGDPVGELTGADWQSRTHVDLLMEKCDVWVDGRKIMEAGKYLSF